MRHLKLYEDYKKNQWELLLSNPNKIQEGEKLVDLVGNAYKNTSMGSFVNTVKDVVKSNWAVIDCDDVPGIDACIFFREPRTDENWIGRKLQGIGHDGEKKSKSYIIDIREHIQSVVIGKRLNLPVIVSPQYFSNSAERIVFHGSKNENKPKLYLKFSTY